MRQAATCAPRSKLRVFQRLRPAELVAAIGTVHGSETASVRDALSTLTDHGIRVVTTDEAITAGPDWARPLATAEDLRRA